MAAIVTHAPIVDRSRIIGAYGPADRTLRRRRRPRRRVLRHAPQIGAREIDVLGATISDRTQGTGCQAAHARPDEQARGARGGSGRDLRRARDGGENRHPDSNLGPARCPTRHGATTSSAGAITGAAGMGGGANGAAAAAEHGASKPAAIHAIRTYIRPAARGSLDPRPG